MSWVVVSTILYDSLFFFSTSEMWGSANMGAERKNNNYQSEIEFDTIAFHLTVRLMREIMQYT